MNNIDKTQNKNNGNKLPEYYDEPLDLFYKKYIIIIMPYFYKLGITPNFITTLSLFFGLLTCYLYYKQYYILSGLSYIISYFFDVMDGYYARLYNMKSKFGSYYDVISDITVDIILFILFIIKLTTNKLIALRLSFVFVYSLFFNKK
jgi:phosphatidylglycerophosphate synthase